MPSSDTSSDTANRPGHFLSGLAIRHQLLIWVLVPLFSLCALSSLFAYNLASRYATEWHDSYLLNSADSIAARLYRNEEGIALADIPSAAKAVLKHNGLDTFYFQIVDSSGHRLMGDAILPLPQDLSSPGAKFKYFKMEGRVLRMCRIPVNLGPTSNGIWVQVAESTNSKKRLLNQILFSIMTPQLALVALASLSVWLGIKYGLLPLDKLGARLKSKRPSDLTPVEIGKVPAELQPVLGELNLLLVATGKFVKAQRDFTGNAAHQLRTPITALITYVECAQKLNRDSEVAAVLSHIESAADRTSHIVSRLLSLARSEGKVLEMEPVDLIAILTDVGGLLVPQGLKKNLELSFDMPNEGLFVMANRGDLEELVSNLVENAITYTPAGGTINIEASGDATHVVLIVEDDGPGIPDEEKGKIFERFYRATGASSTGCGLGLSIVAEVAKTLNTTVTVSDGTKGGAKFTVTFPAYSHHGELRVKMGGDLSLVQTGASRAEPG